jgi:hypothetical protein
VEELDGAVDAVVQLLALAESEFLVGDEHHSAGAVAGDPASVRDELRFRRWEGVLPAWEVDSHDQPLAFALGERILAAVWSTERVARVDVAVALGVQEQRG